MNLEELEHKLSDFREQVDQYRQLLLRSRDSVMPEIVRNGEQIKNERSKLNKIFGLLEKYIKKLGKNPKMSDGVWNVLFPAYETAFSTDTLLRVGPSLDMVLQDLDYISGKLEGISEKDFQEIINPPQIKQEAKQEISETLSKKDKRNYWDFINPFWLFWQILIFAWRHKIISFILTIVAGLTITYLSFKFGWTK